MRKRLSFKELVAKNKEQLLKDETAIENIYKKIDDKNTKEKETSKVS